MSRNRSRNTFQNTFKDYLVPIIGWVIILILIISLLWWDNESENIVNPNTENQTPVNISFSSEWTEAFIMYPWDERKQIQAWAELYKWESVIVKEWVVNLNFWNSNSVSLNRVAELKYNEDASLSLYSSDAWLKLAESTKISMRYGDVESPAGSILSLTQNEASSTIYVLDGSAKVTNLWWASTALIAWQKLSISRQFASNEDADLAGDKWNIDSYFKSSDWFIENQGHLSLNLNQEWDSWELSGTWSATDTGETWVFLRFNSIRDEWNINTSSLDITGNILSDSVELITINGKQANIESDNSFSVNEVITNQSVNDIVVKIYDESRSILDKQVITLYNSNPTSTSTTGATTSENNTNSASNSINAQWVTTFWVDATNFTFTEPSASGKFSTTASEVTIRWATTAENISKVEVNWFQLASFNGSTWRYHAFERFETLEAGTNQYRVDYYGENGKIVYTDYYTIVKRDAETPTTTNTQENQNNNEDSTEEEANNEENIIPPEEELFQ